MLSRVAKDNRVILESFSGTKEQVCHSVIELQWSKRKELGPWDLSRGGCFRISKWEIHQNQHGLAKRPLFFDVFLIAFSWEWLPAIDGDIGRPVLERSWESSCVFFILPCSCHCPSLSGGTLRADSRSGWGISSINGGNLCCDCDSGETKHCHIAFPLLAVLNFAHKLGT